MIKFGPAGNCEMFYEYGYKSTYQMPEFLAKIGLDAYEIQCGRGVRMGDDAAKILANSAAQNNITLSVHAHLKGHRQVKTFRLGVYGEGDSGVTVVELK